MKVNRRTFLKSGGLFTLAVTASLYGGNILSKIPLKDLATNKDIVIPEKLRSILYYGALAPSGHNAQPWKVVITSENSFDLLPDYKRFLPEIDPSGRESFLSLGAFLENCTQAASSLGLNLNYNIKVGNNPYNVVISVKTTEAERKKINTAVMKKRRTIRSGHKNTPPEQEFIDSLCGISDSVLYYRSGSDEANVINNYMIEATTLQSKNKKIMKELGEWIRWKNSQAEKYKDGLTPDSMELGVIAKIWVSLFYNKESVLDDSFASSTISTTENQLESFGGWLIISSEDNKISSVINAGMMMEKLFLISAENNKAFHIMSQVLEEPEISDKLTKVFNLKEIPQFIVRISNIDEYPEPVSLRRDTMAFTEVS